MHNPLPALILLAFWFGRIDSASILAVVPVNSRSHFIVMEPLFRALASRGHQITVVGLYPQKTPRPNYTDIDVSDLFPSKSLSFAIDYIKANIYSTTNCVKAVASIGYDTCRVVYKDERISQLYNSSAKFDLVITEIFSSDCFVMFAEKFDAPIISFVTSVALPWSNDRIGNPENPSYIVNYFHAFAHQMSLYERVVNTASLIYSKALYYYEADFTHVRLLGEIFGGDRVPDLYEIYNRRTAMVFVNSHYTVNQPRPMVPNFIEIGGIHVQQSAPLPKDLQELLDKADKGFILFSMGTLVNMSTFSDHVLTSFLKTFSSFEDLLVLWKHDGQLPNQPKNVITRKFFPQKDILVHKNLKMFITHGGLSSTLEVVNAGVPIMGIPMFGDQPGNVMNLVRRGAGISIDYDSITTELLTTAINKILQDNSYKENALKLSRLFNDRPQSALDSAVFWTEHVLKHRGAPHMRSAAADMPLYKVLLLDAAAIFLLATFIVCAAIHKIIVHFFRPAQKQRQTTGKTSKKRD